MNKHLFVKKERGVVLLTCLVFLLVLLLMLRFVIVSARTEEQKSGIDLDIVTAREAAQSALNFAEFYVREQGIAYCQQIIRESSATCQRNPLAYANLLFSLDDASLNSLASTVATLPNVSVLNNNGIYTGTFLDANARNCNPVWICVNWPAQAHAVVSSATNQRTISGGATANLNFITCPANACNNSVTVQPVFIIERLTARELDPDASGLGDSSVYVNGSKGVILRVTAVGFGAGAANADNLTNVMLQNTYILPNS